MGHALAIRWRRAAGYLLVLGLCTAALVSTPARQAAGHHSQTTRVSVNSAGEESNSPSDRPDVSADGRFVAFESQASNLILEGTNGAAHIFVHDRQKNETTRVSVPSNGVEVSGDSHSPTISADGRFVAFHSRASNLVPNDTNGAQDVFVHDRQTGETTRVSLSSSGLEANDNSYTPSLSGDGRFVAFQSKASNLISDDANGRITDVFVHDRQLGETSRISIGLTGADPNDESFQPDISSDGRFVAFTSWASNLVLGDANETPDVFLHNRDTGDTSRVSVDSNGVGGNLQSESPSISEGGDFIAFYSSATNLSLGDLNLKGDVFVHERRTGETTRVSLDSNGKEANDYSGSPSLSLDGRFVAFRSSATNLVPGDTNGKSDIYVRDRATKETERVSVDSAEVEGDGSSYQPAISGDGRFVSFTSHAANLSSSDTNGVADIFVRDRGETAPPTIDSFQADPQAFSPNGDGVQDTTTFSASVSDDSPPLDWELEIRNAAGLVVRTFSGELVTGVGEITQGWDGTSESGEFVLDGEYEAVLSVTDHWGNAEAAIAGVTVDTVVPVLIPDSLVPVGGSNTAFTSQPFFARAADRGSGIEEDGLELSVHDELGTVVQNDIQVTYDPEDGLLKSEPVGLVPSQSYHAVWRVSDGAGNAAEHTQGLPFRVSDLTIPDVDASVPTTQCTVSSTINSDVTRDVTCEPMLVSGDSYVELSASAHGGEGFLRLEAPLSSARLRPFVGADELLATEAYSPSDSFTLDVVYQVATGFTGSKTFAVPGHAAKMPVYRGKVPAHWEEAYLSMDAVGVPANTPACADPATAPAPCTPDPIIQRDSIDLGRMEALRSGNAGEVECGRGLIAHQSRFVVDPAQDLRLQIVVDEAAVSVQEVLLRYVTDGVDRSRAPQTGTGGTYEFTIPNEELADSNIVNYGFEVNGTFSASECGDVGGTLLPANYSFVSLAEGNPDPLDEGFFVAGMLAMTSAVRQPESASLKLDEVCDVWFETGKSPCDYFPVRGEFVDFGTSVGMDIPNPESIITQEYHPHAGFISIGASGNEEVIDYLTPTGMWDFYCLIGQFFDSDCGGGGGSDAPGDCASKRWEGADGHTEVQTSYLSWRPEKVTWGIVPATHTAAWGEVGWVGKERINGKTINGIVNSSRSQHTGVMYTFHGSFGPTYQYHRESATHTLAFGDEFNLLAHGEWDDGHWTIVDVQCTL